MHHPVAVSFEHLGPLQQLDDPEGRHGFNPAGKLHVRPPSLNAALSQRHTLNKKFIGPYGQPQEVLVVYAPFQFRAANPDLSISLDSRRRD
jgi:hypothetical protein